MTIAGTNITKSDSSPGVLQQFQTQVTNVINAAEKWSADGTDKFLSKVPIPGYSISTTNFGGVDPLKSGQTLTSQPDPGSLTTPTILASAIELALRNASVVLSNARKINLKKYYYNSAYAPVLWADYGVVMAHLSDAYRIAIGSVPGSGGTVTSGANISATTLDAYVTTLNNTLQAHQNSTVQFTEYWCHSACHSSHSSRNRR